MPISVHYMPLFALLAFAWFTGDAQSSDTTSPDVARRPVAVTLQNNVLVVANRAGSIAIVDRASYEIAGETRVASELADMAAIPGSEKLLAVDPAGDQLILLSAGQAGVQIVDRCAVPTHPVSVCVLGGGRTCAVSSLWARRLTLLEIDDHGETLSTRHVIDLPFAPRLQIEMPTPGLLLVADSFAGELAVIDVDAGRIAARRTIDAHNIRGLAISPDRTRLLIAHQMLNPNVPTVRERVFWGAVVSNVLRSIAWEDILPVGPDDVAARPVHHWMLYPLGQPNRAAGDPGPLAHLPDGTLLVGLSGVGELGFDPVGEMNDTPRGRITVGQRPTAIAVDSARRQAFVANTLEDTISVVDTHKRQVVRTIRLSPNHEVNLIERGEQLFYDARLSLDGWMSCHSCHTDGHANGQLNDNLSDTTTGTPKRVLSLLGTDATGPWAWNGRQSRLDQQIASSIKQTMRGPEHAASRENIDAIAAYLGTLEPPPSISAARRRLDHALIAQGEKVFSARGCTVCHQPAKYTTADIYDVGVTDEAGLDEFNPPSLLGVSQRGPYFHDHRAADLRSVLVDHTHAGAGDLSAEALTALLAFLKSL